MASATASALKSATATAQRIGHYARFPPTALSLSQMAQFGQTPSTATVYRASQFMADELPVRIAHRIRELENLPDGLADAPSIQRVRGWYMKSFDDITDMQKYAQENIPDKVRTKLLQVSSDSLSMPAQHFNNTSQNDFIKPSLSVSKGSNNEVQDHNSHHSKSFFGSLKDKLFSGFGNPLAQYDGDQKWPEEVHQYLQKFSECLTNVRKRHDAVVTTMAQGIKEYSEMQKKQTQNKPSRNNNNNSNNINSSFPQNGFGTGDIDEIITKNGMIEPDFAEQRIQSFLDRFFMSRIGIRMLIGQQLALMEGKFAPNYVGIICTNTSIKQTIQHAVTLASEICEDTYGLYEGPKVIIECDPELRFMYIPAHLSHMIFELVKNSLRAVVEKYGIDSESSQYPPVTIVVGDGSEDITIRISDKGGGIPRSVQQRVWMYNYTTVKEPPKIGPEFSEPMMGAPMAGFGYGLPITRLYARYFGGDVVLQSIEGYGTDVYMHLNKLSTRELIF